MILNVLKLLKKSKIPVLFYSRIHQFKYKMGRAYIRQRNDENFEMVFQYVDRDLRLDRPFTFHRKFSETIDTFLTRICVNVEKLVNKKNKKKKKEETNEPTTIITASFISNGNEIPRDRTCKEFFKENQNIVLKVNSHVYEVMVNTPWVEQIALPFHILANLPLYPYKFEGIFLDKSLSHFSWLKSKTKSDWIPIGESYYYTPTNEDIGFYIKLICIPKNSISEGPIVEVISRNTVEACPGNCPFETRHAFTKTKLEGKEFRVVSYNILADVYTDSSYSRKVLFPYCPTYALSMDYRIQLLLKEIIGYHADIICLQEVDGRVFKNHLIPCLSELDYECVLHTKGSNVDEGLAFFFNTKRFKSLDSRRVVFSEELSTNPIFCPLFVALSKNDKLMNRVLLRNTVFQVNILESLECKEILVVANTHLYFHPDSDHIRLIHGGMAIKYLEELVKDLKKKITDKRISLIFCGDFNSVPECGIYQLYTTGCVPGDHFDYHSNTVEGMWLFDICQSFKLGSACGTPPYTNYTVDFNGCLDYIYYDMSNLNVTQVIPLPSHDEVTHFSALPSVVFPSDHIALVADLKYS